VRDPADVAGVVSHYPDMYLVVGDVWVITAASEASASAAAERVEGAVDPAEVCCSPPVSEHLPR